MKTQEQKLRHVMEAADECCHNITYDPNETVGRCTECHNWWDDSINPSPSPDDLNELFRLAEKLEYKVINTDIWADTHFANITRLDRHAWHKGQGGTRTRALLNALFIATGGKDE